MKYNKVPEQDSKSTHSLAHGVKIHSDGVIEAAGFRDNSVDGLEYEEIRDQGVKFTKRLDDETSIEYVPKSAKVYRTEVKRSFSIKNIFAKIKGEVKKFIIESLPRFKHSSKRLKNEIKKILKEKSKWNFTKRRSGEQWSQVYINSTTFGPYNYDVKIKAGSDLTFVNDVIVVKTGTFASSQPGEETIVYMSPHESYRFEGESQYCTTGETITTGVFNLDGGAGVDEDSASVVTFNNRNLGITTGVPTFFPTSNMIRIPSGEYLSHGHNYDYHDESASYSDTNDELLPSTIIGQTYDEYAEKLETGVWDGIIPSGAWFRVETWSFNSDAIGFAGDLNVEPTGAMDCSYNATFTAESSHTDYREARDLAERKVEQKFYRGLNGYLVHKGIKNKNSRMLRYEKMKRRVAQNVYDGLSSIREKTIAKLDDNSLSYYDGTAKTYGGSDKESDLDYKNIAQQKLLDGRIYGAEAIGVSPEAINNPDGSSDEDLNDIWTYNTETGGWERQGGSY